MITKYKAYEFVLCTAPTHIKGVNSPRCTSWILIIPKNVGPLLNL